MKCALLSILRPFLLTTLLGFLVAPPVLSDESVDQGASLRNRRVVHLFDFDERDEGNLEDEPKYWTRLSMSGFPPYATGQFDFERGRGAPPSFEIRCEGRNVAYLYAGPATRVRRNTDYRVEAYLRTDQLSAARACFSAHYLDKDGQVIPDTMVRSPFIGGTDTEGSWHHLELFLPPAPLEARTIGLIAWILQEDEWRRVLPPHRHIQLRDVHGRAWLDDIAVYALPRVELATATPDQVLTPGGPQDIEVLIADYEDETLEGSLSIFDAAGRRVAYHTVAAVVGEQIAPTRLSTEELPPGLYRAELQVRSGTLPLMARELTFARVAPRLFPIGQPSRAFGFVLDPDSRGGYDAEHSFLRHSAAGAAKIPLWSGRPEDPAPPAEKKARDRFLQNLSTDGIALTGVLAGPPGVIAKSDGPYPRPLWELLSADPAVWRDHLAEIVVPYAGMIEFWQLGRDGDIEIPSEEDLGRGVEHVREVMARFLNVVQLALPIPDGIDFSDIDADVDAVTLTTRARRDVDPLREMLSTERERPLKRINTYIEPLWDARYQRIPALADWLQRLVAARFITSGTVYVPQLWSHRDDVRGQTSEPKEHYILLRTVADLLGTAAAHAEPDFGDNISALAFSTSAGEVIALWDPGADAHGRVHAIQFGAADRVVDAWGRVGHLQRGPDGRHRIRLSPMPVFVIGTEPWLIDLHTKLRFEPARFSAGNDFVRHQLALTYTGPRSLTGRLRFAEDNAWEIEPREIDLQFMPRRPETIPVSIRYPHVTPSGTSRLIAALELKDPPYVLKLSIPVSIGLADIDVTGHAARDADDLVLTQIITNRSKKPLNLRSMATVPARERQYRPITNLAPGESQTVEYRFKQAATLSGARVRLALREMNDGPRVHTLELSVP